MSEIAPRTILRSGAKSPLIKAFILIALFLDEINTTIEQKIFFIFILLDKKLVAK